MIGQTISHCRIFQRLGGGGMGIVYKAEDTRLKRTVALKFLPPELTRDPEAKERFSHKAQAASAFQHNNICVVHDIVEKMIVKPVKTNRRYKWLWVLLMSVCIAQPGTAGPPFKTDDPQPVDFLHWEFYLASEQQFAKDGVGATLPHIEINFGAFRNVQLHFVAPMGYVRTGDRRAYGYSDTEIGAKYRFVEESDNFPQIGIFPLIEIPTGDKGRQLGQGSVQAYLPIWFQKSWGKFTIYGGGGFWYNPGAENKNWLFAGWEAQYDFSDTFTLGGELYYHTADKIDEQSGAGFNVGGFINLNENNHILFSVGQSLRGDNVVTGYLGFQYTI